MPMSVNGPWNQDIVLTDDEADNTSVCPRLRVLHTENMYWELGLAEALMGVLRLRAAYGLPQLETLGLNLRCRDEEGDEGNRTMERYKDEISSHVGRYDWLLDVRDY